MDKKDKNPSSEWLAPAPFEHPHPSRRSGTALPVIPPNLASFGRPEKKNRETRPSRKTASQIKHEVAVFNAIHGMICADLLPLIELLKSDCPSIGKDVRRMLAELLSEPSSLGKSLILTTNKGFNTQNKAPMDKSRDAKKHHRVYKVFRKYRMSGLSYEKALLYTADQLGMTTKTVDRYRGFARAHMEQVASDPRMKEVLPYNYKDMIV